VIAGSRFDADSSFGRQKTRPDPDHAIMNMVCRNNYAGLTRKKPDQMCVPFAVSEVVQARGEGYLCILTLKIPQD
jgi:hypothetical protein